MAALLKASGNVAPAIIGGVVVAYDAHTQEVLTST